MKCQTKNYSAERNLQGVTSLGATLRTTEVYSYYNKAIFGTQSPDTNYVT